MRHPFIDPLLAAGQKVSEILSNREEQQQGPNYLDVYWQLRDKHGFRDDLLELADRVYHFPDYEKLHPSLQWYVNSLMSMSENPVVAGIERVAGRALENLTPYQSPHYASTGYPTIDTAADIAGATLGQVAQYMLAGQVAGALGQAAGRIIPQLGRIGQLAPSALRAAGHGAATGAISSGMDALKGREVDPRQVAQSMAWGAGAGLGGQLTSQALHQYLPGINRILEGTLIGAGSGVGATAAGYPFAETKGVEYLKESAPNILAMAALGGLRSFLTPEQSFDIRKEQQNARMLKLMREGQAAKQAGDLRLYNAKMRDYWETVNSAWSSYARETGQKVQMPDYMRQNLQTAWDTATSQVAPQPPPQSQVPPQVGTAQAQPQPQQTTQAQLQPQPVAPAPPQPMVPPVQNVVPEPPPQPQPVQMPKVEVPPPRPAPAPVQPTQPQVDIAQPQVGETVYWKGNPVQVVNNSDKSLLTVRNQQGTELKIDRKAVSTVPDSAPTLEPQQSVVPAQPQSVAAPISPTQIGQGSTERTLDSQTPTEPVAVNTEPPTSSLTNDSVTSAPVETATEPAASPATNKDVGRVTPTEVTVTKQKPFSEMDTEELVSFVKSLGKERQASYGQFVKYRNLKPEINAKEFNRIWDQVSARNQETREVVSFTPTHVLKGSGVKVMVTKDDGVNPVEYVTEYGAQGSSPRAYWNEEYVTALSEAVPTAEQPAQPEAATTAPPKPRVTGTTARIVTDAGTRLETQYAVVDVNDLVTSHTRSLEVNPDYPQELQPRDRSRLAYEGQVRRIVNTLVPERLGESVEASHGAPIVGDDLVVESGNGRVIALQRSYDANTEKIQQYKQWLVDNAEKFGIDKEALQQIQNPVLVRVRQTEIDRAKFGREANIGGVSGMSATEQAKADAEILTPDMLAKFNPGEEGNILAASNREFVSSFMSGVVGTSDMSKFVTSDGSLSQDGVNRIRNAVFMKAYNDSSVMEKLAEETDSNVKNITTGMVTVAPRMAEMRERIEDGALHNLDVTQELVKAVKKMTALRTEGTKVDVYLNQGQLFSDDMTPEDLAMLKVVNQYSRSAKKLKKLFNNMVDIVYGAGHPEQEVLFGDMKKEPPTKIEVIQRAAKMIEVEEQSVLGDVKDTEAQSLGEIDTPFRLEEVSKNDVLVGAENASVGMYARPITSPEEVKPIEMPELVEIAKEINKGIYPEIRKAIRSGHGTALGTFIRNTESGKIVLRADIFLGQEIATLKGKPKSDQERQIAIDKIIDKVVKTHGGTPDDYVVKWEKNKANGQTIFHVYEVDPELAPKVLAHEIGHLIDWLPDKDMSRGNILGHIATLKKFMSTTIGAIPKKPDDYLKPQERAKFARMAEKEAGEDEELRKTLYDNLVAAEIKKRGLVTRDQIMEELKALSQAWKPFDESSATPQYLKYRYSPKELYADFVSVLFNDSTVASRYAPSVSQMFIDYLERKPEVKTALESVQDRYLDRNELKQQRLIDLYAMMERGDELRQLARENNVTTYEPIKDTIATALIDANWPLLKRIAQREKDPIELIREAATQARYAIESLAYVDSRIEAMWRGYADLIQDATDNGVSANDIGVYGFLRRVAYERTQLANPKGHTPETAKELIEFMEGKLDEDKVAFLQTFGDEFHRTRKQMILPALEEGGIITDQLLEYAKSNAVYMKFDVAKYFEETFGEAGAKLYRQIGTLDEIANPWIATMLQDAALLRAAAINKAKLTIMKDLIIGGDAVPADMVYSKDRGGLVPKEPKDKEKALFVVMEKGKPRYYYVDREIAKTFEYEPHKATQAAQLWNLASAIVKDAIVGKNPIWQARNIPRDFFESYKKLDVVGVLDAPKLAAMYGKAFIESVRYVFGGNASEDIQKGLWEMALPSGRIYDARDKHWEDEIDRISYEWLGKLLPTDTSEKLKANHLVTLADKFNSTLPMRLLERAGRVSDLTGKLAAYKYIEKYAPEMSVEQRAHDVRTKAATPNFKARGTKHALMNNLFAWSNVRIQGLRASVESYRKNPSRFIWKTILANILPKVALWGISMWGTGTVAKKVIDKASEYNKRNYLFIPLGLTEDGKDAVYLRLPQDDFGTAISAGVWDALWTISSVIKKDGEWDERALKALRETAVAANPYSLHPLIDVGMKAGVLYGLGINPQDTWRGYSVISPLAFQAGGWDMHKEFLAYTWNALGGSAFYTMPTSVEIDKDESQLKKTLRKPLANIVGTFLRIDHAGETEQVYKILEDTASEEAKPKLAKNKAIIEAVNAGKSAIIAYNELAKAGLVDKKKESLTQFTNTYEKYQAKKEGDPWVMGIYAASTAKQKAALFKKMPADIRKRFEKEYDTTTGYKK